MRKRMPGKFHCRLLIVAASSFVIFFLWTTIMDRWKYSSSSTNDIVYPKIRYVPFGRIRNDDDGRKYRIPRIIHQTWKSDEVPLLFKKWMETWLVENPDWEYWFWDDEDCRRLIKKRYPQFLKLYDSYPSSGYRVDVFRYFALYEYGGFYSDIDVENRKPLDPILTEFTCILSQEPEEHAHFLSPMGLPLVSNAIMACGSKHPFFRHVIDNMGKYAGYFGWNDILHATGPYMLTEVYRGYIKSGNDYNHVTLAEADAFQPSVDDSMLDRMKEVCMNSRKGKWEILPEKFIQTQKKLCEKITHIGYVNEAKEHSYTNHYWTHTWATNKHDPWGIKNMEKTFNVEDILP